MLEQNPRGRLWNSAFAWLLLLVTCAAFQTVGADPVGSTIEARALLKPHQQAMLSSEIAGHIVQLSLREGERFKKGEKLVSFDCAGFEAVEAAAQATLAHAHAKFAGLEVLAAQHATGTMDVALADTPPVAPSPGLRS